MGQPESGQPIAGTGVWGGDVHDMIWLEKVMGILITIKSGSGR